MKSYVIHLIRNGLTAENLEGRYIGHTDSPLSEDGKNQLAQLKEELVFPRVEAVFSSPLSRCTETAKILYPEHNPIIIDGLIEYNFGEFENKTADELKKNETFSDWLSGDPEAKPEYGESNAEFAARVCAAFEAVVTGVLKTGITNTAIVTHGGVIMALLEAYGIPELPMHEWLCPNGCGFSVRINTSLWMRARKLEVFSEFPYEKEELDD